MKGALLSSRDLKLDNTLLDQHLIGPEYPPILKLCDFGFAKDWTVEANMYTSIGYVSAESFFNHTPPGPCAESFVVQVLTFYLSLARDLKLDNTLLSSDDPPLIKLCDFGFAREWQADALMYTHIGYAITCLCPLVL